MPFVTLTCHIRIDRPFIFVEETKMLNFIFYFCVFVVLELATDCSKHSFIVSNAIYNVREIVICCLCL